MGRPKIPSEEERLELYEKHGGNFHSIAREVKRSASTISSWYLKLGLGGKGAGRTPTLRPPDFEEIYRNSNSAHEVANRLGVSVSAVYKWAQKLGISHGIKNYQSVYPQVVSERLDDGFVVCFSDAHLWFEEKSRAHEALLVALKKLKPAIVIANGDVLDGARISRHDPSGVDPLPTLADELHVTKAHMAEIARASNEAKRYFTLGNHDSRLSRYLAIHAPEMDGVDGTRLEHHILGWDFCVSLTINEDVVVKHAFRGGIHATYNNTLHDGRTIVTGHLHAQMVRPFTDARGTRYGVDLGCLADPSWPQFNYTIANTKNWRSGFGVLEFSKGKLLPPMLASVVDDGSVYLQRNDRLI